MRHGCGFLAGGLLVLLGLGLLLNVVLGISIPVFPILFGLAIIYLGIRILTGGRWGRWGEWHHVSSLKSGDRHDVVFGRSDVDLTGITLQSETVYVEASTVFGSSDVRIDARTPTKIFASVAFGGVRLPDGGTTAFGDHVWKSAGLDEAKPHIELHISCVFGSVRVSSR